MCNNNYLYLRSFDLPITPNLLPRFQKELLEACELALLDTTKDQFKELLGTDVVTYFDNDKHVYRLQISCHKLEKSIWNLFKWPKCYLMCSLIREGDSGYTYRWRIQNRKTIRHLYNLFWKSYKDLTPKVSGKYLRSTP